MIMKALFVEVAVLALLAVPFVNSISCYDTSGNLNQNFYPCDVTLEISSCCSGTDLCLSNGLCLDDGGNNLLSQQGCTDPNWGSPCHKFCPQKLCELGL